MIRQTASVLLCLFCISCSPNKPDTTPIVQSNADTSVYILDTLVVSAEVSCPESILSRTWTILELTGVTGDSDSFRFTIPETATGP